METLKRPKKATEAKAADALGGDYKPHATMGLPFLFFFFASLLALFVFFFFPTTFFTCAVGFPH